MRGEREGMAAGEPRARGALRFWVLAATLVLGTELAARVLLPPWPYYRAWNVAHRDSGPFEPIALPGPFFPHVEVAQEGYGDLAFQVNVPALRQERAETFTTDGLGFRNPGGHEHGPWHAVTFGDSMMAGAGLADRETFSARLAERLGEFVYAAGGANATLAMADERWLETPPRFFVLESLERYLHVSQLQPLATFAPGSVAALPAVSATQPPATRGRWSRAYSAATHWGALLHGSLRYWLFGELYKPDCFLGTDGRTLFHFEELAHAEATPEMLGVERIADILARVRDALATHGIQLVYLVSPDKATLARELIPSGYRARMRPAGETIEALQRALEARGVVYVDVLGAFRAAQAAQPDRDLYWRDDTHWTPHGADVAAAAAARVLERLSAGS